MTRTRSLILLASIAGLTACLMPSTASAAPFSPPAWFSESVAQIKQHNPAANCDPTLQTPGNPDNWQIPSSNDAPTGPTGCAYGNGKHGSPGSPTGNCSAGSSFSSTPSFNCDLGVSMLPYPAMCSRRTDTNGDIWMRFAGNEIIAKTEYAALSECLNSLEGVFQVVSHPPKLSIGGPLTISFTKPGKLVVTDSSDSLCRAGHCSGKSKKKYVHRMQAIKLTVPAAGVQTVQIKQSKAGRKLFKKLGKLQLAIDLKFTPAGGGPVRTARLLMVMRKQAQK